MKRTLTSLALLLTATPASAHLPPGEYGSVAAGITHPLFGLDHVLAMVAVGLWAAMLGGRALWQVPGAFVAAMATGFALALTGMPLPLVEPMILASTVVLGALVAMALRVDVRLCMGLVAVFALFHGHAHGGELGEASALRFGVGFVLATAALHGLGLGLGLLITRMAGQGQPLLRALGGLTALAGVALSLG
ncbi:HupE/UreJ family protein [Pseudooceanicola onchidii]|uniref:HupE/UreJ family protein n=1 Tax=Pseudooceanicola onchidii TaxID=2562279 RepID=UPI0010AA238E|nr:HupE/UreJ family protein [Pseudooceanicola onchidii]